MSDEVLIVVSKLKSYVKQVSELNTSSDVPDVLSTIVKNICSKAVESAKSDGRKTLMARDFKDLIS